MVYGLIGGLATLAVAIVAVNIWLRVRQASEQARNVVPIRRQR